MTIHTASFRIHRIRLYQTRIGFRVSFAHATHHRHEVQGIVLELTSACGRRGYGEVLPRSYVSGETHQSVVDELSTQVLPLLQGRQFADLDELCHYLQHFYSLHPTLPLSHTCVRTAVDLALWDLAGHIWQQPAAVLLQQAGGRTTALASRLCYSGTYGASNARELQQYQQAYQALKLGVFKLKVGVNLAAELQLLRQLQQAHPGARWRVDANGAWDLATAYQAIEQFSTLGIESVEQPLPAHDKQSYVTLMRDCHAQMPIVLDESFCQWSDVQYFLDAGVTPALNLRVSKCGGLWSSLAYANAASAAGLWYQLGAQVGESVILTRAGQILASVLADCRYHEGAVSDYLLAHDLTSQPVSIGQGGILNGDAIRHNAGLALHINPNLLAQCITACQQWECRDAG